MDKKHLISESRQFLNAYAWILFLDRPIVGLIFIFVTFWFPNIGLSGLIAAFTAALSVYFFKFTFRESGIHLFNAALVGLSLGAFYQLDITLFLLIIISALLTVFTTVMIMNMFQKLESLPVLTLPFVLVSITLAFAAKSYGNLVPYHGVQFTSTVFFAESIDAFFTALGSIFFTPHPLVGAVIFFAILWRSRYLALLAIVGFLVGFNLFVYLSASPYTQLAVLSSFNFSLTAMALGAIYSVPGIRSFFVAVAGAAIAAIVTAAVQSFMAIYSLPVMALPFLLTTLTILSALSTRQTMDPPWLRLDSPDLPERHYEQARIAKFRIGDIKSVPLLAPFFGSWHIYQGFYGEHTHQPPWQYALDFIMMEDGKSYEENGVFLSDYHCFGLPVISPVYGQVVRIYDELPDNLPGEVDLKNNWGNFVLIQLEGGLYVLLAHLKQHSIKVKEKQKLTPSEVIAACGNSGRSPQPHLHMQVQRTAMLGSDTYPFHLTNIITSKEKTQPQLKLVSVPKQNDQITPLRPSAELSVSLHLPVGHMLCYSFTDFNNQKSDRKLVVTLTLLGEFRINSSSGASAAFVESNGILAFYDRIGPNDIFFDMWILAMGLTPLTGDVNNWIDSPSALLIPLTPVEKLKYHLLFPLGTGLESSYSRKKEEHKKHWTQSATHKLSSFFISKSVETRCELTFDKGCEYVEMTHHHKTCFATLIDSGSLSDIGIPSS